MWPSRLASRRRNKTMGTEESRRAFLKAVPVAVAGAVATRTFAQQAPTGPVSAQTVNCAESIAGLDFHTAEEEAIARGGHGGGFRRDWRMEQAPRAEWRG